VINQQLNKATGKYGLVFGPDPSSHSRCTLGGNLGNNSCGAHSIQAHLYGPGPRTSDNTHALDIITYDGARFSVGVNEEKDLDTIIAAGGRKGEIYAALRDLRDEYADDIRKGYPSVDALPRRVSGYNLDELLPEKGFNVARALVGTESTCAVVLTATVMLTPAMFHRTLVVVQYDSLPDAGDAVPEIMAWKPIGLEAVDHYDDDRIVLARSTQDGGNSEELWAIREAGLGSTAFPADGGDFWPGWEDSAAPPHRIGDYLRDLQRLYADHGLSGAMLRAPR
jgi:FAD/FMN-containing dehydrogenase